MHMSAEAVPYHHDANIVIRRMRNRDQSFRTHLCGELGCLSEKVIPRDERSTPKYLELNLLLVLVAGFAWHIWIYVNTRLTSHISHPAPPTLGIKPRGYRGVGLHAHPWR